MSLPRTRRRVQTVVPATPYSASYEYNFAYPIQTFAGVSTPVVSTQVTTSSGNPWHRKEMRGKRDIGSNFETTRGWYAPGSGGPSVLEGKILGYKNHRVNGALWRPAVPPTPATFEALERSAEFSSALTLNGMGATAIARTIPTNPAVDMMTFMGETVKDGIPKVLTAQTWGGKKPPSSKASDEYLAWQFGALPFVSDLVDLADTVRHQDKILAQYERDSGKNVRRSYQFDPIITSSTTVSRDTMPYHPASWNPGLINKGRLDEERRTERRVWFSGCFTYYLALGKDTRSRLERNAQIAKRLYGIRVTPDVLWNLAPWSWAADWFANTGDVLHNLSAFSQDGLVMRYGYVMEETTITRTRQFRSERTGSPHSLTLTDSYGITRKVRQRATPYGFGLDPDGFTAKQVSILAALGLSAQGRK